MPFTRISLHAGKPAAYLSAVCDSLDRALVHTFDVPANDRFVVIHQHQPGELIFDRTYGGGPRSDDFILFHITTGRIRAEAIQARFFQSLVTELAAAPGIRPQDVMIVVANARMSDWSFAEGLVATPPSSQARP